MRAFSATGTIPLSIGDLQTLTALDVSSNSLTGSIPSTISYLTKLSSLLLHDNKLTGSLSTSFGSSLTSLTVLHLQDNQLAGTIPLNLLTGNILDLSLGGNSLSGTFPFLEATATAKHHRRFLKQSITRKSTNIVSVGNLNFLDVSGNSLTGTIPSSILYITGLKELYLGDNQFTGTLSLELGDLSKLQVLDVSDNKLDGKLYGSVAGASLLSLDVSVNRLTGIVPLSLCGKNLTLLDFRNNTNMSCYSNCLTSVGKIYSGVVPQCYNDFNTSSGSRSTNKGVTPMTIGLVVMGAVLVCFAVVGLLYYEKYIRRKLVYAYHMESRKIAKVELGDMIRPMAVEGHSLFQGLLKLKVVLATDFNINDIIY